MDFESFKKEVQEKGSEHIVNSLEILKNVDKQISFIKRREKLYSQLNTMCNDILVSYGSQINPSIKISHPLIHHPMNGIEILNLHYYTVYPVLLGEFTEKVGEMYNQKYSNLQD